MNENGFKLSRFKIYNFVKHYFYSIKFLPLQVQHVIMSMQSVRLFQQILGRSDFIGDFTVHSTYQIQLSIVAGKWLNQVQNAVVLLKKKFCIKLLHVNDQHV